MQLRQISHFTLPWHLHPRIRTSACKGQLHRHAWLAAFPGQLSLLMCLALYLAPCAPAEHRVVQWLWQVVGELTQEERKLFLKFFTGSDRAPIGGLGNLRCLIQVGHPWGRGLRAGGRQPWCTTLACRCSWLCLARVLGCSAAADVLLLHRVALAPAKPSLPCCPCYAARRPRQQPPAHQPHVLQQPAAAVIPLQGEAGRPPAAGHPQLRGLWPGVSRAAAAGAASSTGMS